MALFALLEVELIVKFVVKIFTFADSLLHAIESVDIVTELRIVFS